jgi:AcrR family transcriptional regulator
VTMETSKRKLTVLDQITSSDKVRKKIIDTASILYAKKGFTATSIEEISEKAGVSLPVTYHYVKKKSEIMRLIMEDVLNTFQESLKKEIKGIDDPEEKLATATILYCRVLDEQREKVLLIYQKSRSLDKASKTKVMQLEVEVSEIFREIINEGIEKGIFKEVDVDLMAYNILMLVHMWVLKRWHFKKRLTLDKYIDLQLATILNALRK